MRQRPAPFASARLFAQLARYLTFATAAPPNSLETTTSGITSTGTHEAETGYIKLINGSNGYVVEVSNRVAERNARTAGQHILLASFRIAKGAGVERFGPPSLEKG